MLNRNLISRISCSMFLLLVSSEIWADSFKQTLRIRNNTDHNITIDGESWPVNSSYPISPLCSRMIFDPQEDSYIPVLQCSISHVDAAIGECQSKFYLPAHGGFVTIGHVNSHIDTNTYEGTAERCSYVMEGGSRTIELGGNGVGGAYQQESGSGSVELSNELVQNKGIDYTLYQ